MTTIETPVLIIGGGGCGLTSSIFLSNHGVDHLLVERHQGTSILPKAHYLNQRTMEVFRQHGIADALYEVGAPIDKFGQIRWMTSLGGDGPLDRKVIHRMDAFGGGELAERYQADSPVLSTNYPQLRLEPLLRKEAEKRAPGQIRYNHEVLGWSQTDDGVTAEVVNRDTDEKFTVNAKYVIAADGGKTIGPREGVEMVGPTDMVDMVSTHFTADLSEYWDDHTLITWFLNPEGENSWGAGAMVQMGPTWGRNSEEWVVHFAFRPDDPERFNEEAIAPRLRELLRLPEVELQVHKVSHWILDRIVADRWRIGNIFLAGDAAHRQPPTTGLGLNTGIQDAHNLTWKLAQVLSGSATDALLDSYESERKPVSTDGADWALMAFTNHTVIDAGIGLTPGAPLEANIAAFHALFADGLLGDALRHRAAIAIGTQRAEFQAHDVEIGFRYDNGAVVPDGTPPAPRSASGTIYTPTTRPGHRLPHAWVTKDGNRVSTHDLTGNDGSFALIAGTDADEWSRSATVAADKFGITIKVARIGVDLDDTDGVWGEVGEIGNAGAVLIRPDNHVAWRALDRDAQPEQTLTAALETILSRS
ncbi:FAD-dependent monooxygenase [Gordonia rubripertincta]|uniref:FAD-dependent monooxygenase n=2 Tax=Gordonia rubripertincta TaxID=36822 RepID=A0AAW6RCU8_GORRU|nr:FAD-dependent monooxygenase [Gordonia rubripertincta]MDG6783773.1 FAD-dependent monooxygenase [Gordonia rubripertincta]NKY65989.1 aromatic ring hydroxylase [Gordonia rubripertincta]GAB86933.1 putative phenol monooxygenase [Gordonia rubripertincta NBRC 101908]